MLKLCLNTFRKSHNLTNFGFQTVLINEKQDKVNNVFEKVAANYDLMNDLMSFGLHRKWKMQMVDCLVPKFNEKYLDLAGGTGDIAFRICKQLIEKYNYDNPNKNFIGFKDKIVHVSDINASMIEVGRNRGRKMMLNDFIEWDEQNAESLTYSDNKFDAVTLAFGLRNMTNVVAVLDEVHRVLKKGGKFVCMELSHIQNVLFSKMYDKYSFNIIPPLGQIISNDWDSYKYLVESIRTFYNQDQVVALMRKSYFDHVSYYNILGGIATIFVAYK